VFDFARCFPGFVSFIMIKAAVAVNRRLRPDDPCLEDQENAVAAAIERTIHIHGRIGYAEGPQVPHPGAPEYAIELRKFAGWWQRVNESQRATGVEAMAFTAEFGPPGYMHTLPFTGQPVADLWEVNAWMTRFFEEQFQAWSSK